MTCILDDDEVDIEAEIQRELDALEDDNLHIEDVEDDVNSTVKANEAKEDGLPDSIQEYLRLLHSRTEGVEEEVKECEIILEKLPPESLVKEDEALLAKRIKEELGDEYQEHPLVLRDQVLSELEETELREDREKLAAENKDGEENKFALDIIRPGIVEEIQALEEKAQQELRELEKKQAGKDQEREKWYQERRQEEEARWEREKKARVQRQEEFETAQKKLLKEQEALKAKLEMEAKEEERKLQEMKEKFQVEIMAIEEERKKQTEAFVETQQKETEYQKKKQENAAIKIQRFYKGFRVRKQYQPLLEAKKVERIKKRQEELDRIERVEKKLREEAERKKLEDEQRRKQENEKRRRQEEEKRQQDEAEKQRKLMEEKRIREEQERRRLLEEEQRKREEEARKKREEEEKRKKEEEKRKKREEEEKLRQEELKRKMEEERRKAEEEARKKQMEEERLREAEIKRRLEEEKRIAGEENRRRQEEEKRRKELEERRKEEQKRIQEEEKQKEEERKQNVETRRKEEQSKDVVKLKTFQTQNVSQEQREEKSGICEKQKEKKEETKASELKQNEIKSPGLELTKDLETRRLQWVKEHTPWSSTSTVEGRSHPVAMKSKPRRVFSASKHLPALTEEQLLKSSPSNTPLFRVKCIVLRDESSCSMQSLSKCPELRSLTLQNCGLLAVEGLDKCKELQELRIENNKIEAINCRDLTKLEEVSLADNNLASVHGLEGCHGIVSLDLSNNKITRMGDLSTCSKLQQLIMDNNQLINTKGLSSLKNVQHLSLAHNHLARVNEIEKCMLLQTLNLQANNLQEPPQLINCVLLRELRLDDNSISSLDCLSKAWLPLLQLLSVSQNSISQLAPLFNLIMLEFLDISNNLISDTDSLVPGLEGCYQLKTLNIKGNSVHEDPESRTLIQEVLPALLYLDGENVPGNGKATATNQAVFINMCQNQLRSQDDLQSRHKKEISYYTQACDPEMVSKRLRFMSQLNKERFELAVRHLLEHESFTTGDCQSTVREESRQEGNGNMRQTAELHCNLKEERGSGKTILDPLKQRHVAATKIQALWRGWYIRHLIDVNTAKWLATVTIQSAWRGHVVRSQLKRAAKEPWDPQRNSAATVIQAHFRGQRVRRRLAEALRAAQFYDDGDEEEFDYDEEVDLTAFDFDETSLEQGWTPSDTPQLPARGPVLRMPGQSLKTSKSGSHGDVSREPTLRKPRHAWRSADSPITDVNHSAVDKGTIDHDQMSVTSGAQSHLTHRAEELSSEWGFRSSETAELMMRRAKKMKYNPARRKKLLDPNKRLALFKKLEETNKLRDVKPPPTRRQPPARVDYFAAREAIASHLASTSSASEQHNREQMTYSWVYRQAVVHEDEEKNIMADRKEYAPDNRSKKTSPQKTSRSPVSLPHMDPMVLSGRTLPLISSPLFSQSVEEAQSEGTSPRRNSLSSEGRVRFPAIKTHSVPNLLARSTASGDQPIRTEKSNSAGARIDRDSRNKR